ncbi:hypothetical protein Tco_1417695 [Tanacetum coccineum]
MDDPNMTMEEYIKLEEEKAHRRGRVFNWKTATYGKIRVDDDLHDLRSVEAEFPAIVINDAFAPQDALPCKSQVSTPVNDEIDFRISFDESDDEDYTIIYDKNSFSYKMIYVNNLKMDSENDNEKGGMPSLPPPEPTTSYVDDLDFFKDFENEFPAIVYNDAQTSKSDYLTEQTLSPRLNNESDLNDETSLSEYHVVGQNVLYFNDLFPFNIIHPNDLKSDEDNDNNEIDIIQSSEDIAPLDHHVSRDKTQFLCNRVLIYNDEENATRGEVKEDLRSLEITQILRGLIVIAPELPIIDMAELRGSLMLVAGTPQQSPPPPPAAARTVPKRLGILEEDVQGLHRDEGAYCTLEIDDRSEEILHP